MSSSKEDRKKKRPREQGCNKEIVSDDWLNQMFPHVQEDVVSLLLTPLLHDNGMELKGKKEEGLET